MELSLDNTFNSVSKEQFRAAMLGFLTYRLPLFASQLLPLVGESAGMVLPGSVEKNGCLAVKPKAIKLTYAETVRTKATVEVQNRLIMNGLDPTNDLDETKKYNVFVNKVDIKKK